MNDTRFVFSLLVILFVVNGILVLRVQTTREESQAVGRVFPVAVLFRCRWLKYVVALCLFILGTVSGLELLRHP